MLEMNLLRNVLYERKEAIERILNGNIPDKERIAYNARLYLLVEIICLTEQILFNIDQPTNPIWNYSPIWINKENEAWEELRIHAEEVYGARLTAQEARRMIEHLKQEDDCLEDMIND